ncbi:MAG: aminomethyl-transferring glycine dehydrogenase subunit GcvPB [Gammaproteobacteria bacterium]|nr:aminomethyl-transferring glycine dehydrogenase subunit GcvPB [Gammaproteobacteria bacterium]
MPPRLIFEKASPGRRAHAQAPAPEAAPPADLPAELIREQDARLPEVSELDVVRHYTRLSQLNFSIDTNSYPLGSCTMKYNPRACHRLASLPGFLDMHPAAPDSAAQGLLECLYELQEMLAQVTGMEAVSLAPMAGAQGEFAGVAMFNAYHRANEDYERDEIIVPDAAHGTNPATAAMCGLKVREIATGRDGDIELEALDAALGPRTAGIMLTNPSTLGVFERRILEISSRVHAAGGLLYYDGANLNALLGRVLPGDMGFDAMHLNLHKTFSTPHGGGGPGAGAVGVAASLKPFLPVPIVEKIDGAYRWKTEAPRSIGRLAANGGNIGVLLRAWAYLRMLGREGLRRVSDHAVLNANYLAFRLAEAGFDLAYPSRRAGHEFVISLKRLRDETGVSAADFAKAMLDEGFHAPTVYFPLLVPECLLIEPTETESPEALDTLIDAMARIRDQALSDPQAVISAPHRMPIRRPDEVLAARKPDLAYGPALES